MVSKHALFTLKLFSFQSFTTFLRNRRIASGLLEQIDVSALIKAYNSVKPSSFTFHWLSYSF